MLYNPRHDQVTKDLMRAADLLNRDGWCRKDTDDQGRQCVWRALISSIYIPPYQMDADTDNDRFRAALSRLAKHLGLEPKVESDIDIWRWNDHKCKSKQEAVDTLCAAAGLTADYLEPVS